MRTARARMAAVWAALVTAGCASGSGGHEELVVDTAEEQVICFLLPWLCLIEGDLASPQPAGEPAPPGAAADASSSPEPWRPPATFSSWSAVEREAWTEASALATGLYWSTRWPVKPSITAYGQYPVGFRYDAQGELASIGVFLEHHRRGTLAALGQPGIDVRQQEILPSYSQSPFTALPAMNLGAFANPFVEGWEYQSFGVWTNQGIPGGGAQAISFGAPTPAAAVPLNGSASFSGKLAGLYVSPQGIGYTAVADMRVQADFAARSLSLSSSGTTITRDFAAAAAMPGLDVRGTLSYAPGSNGFSGAVGNAGGTMSGSSRGRFYGPAARELGGVLGMRSATTPETFSAAYGAKR